MRRFEKEAAARAAKRARGQIKDGRLDVVISCLKEHTGTPAIIGEACSRLSALFDEGGAAAKIAAADEGLIPLLSRMMVMEAHAASAEVQVARLRAAPERPARSPHAAHS